MSFLCLYPRTNTWSHPSRVRGLKCERKQRMDALAQESHPSRVRGLKLFVFLNLLTLPTSHPSRVRGLKC